MSESDRDLPVSPSSPDPAAALHAELLSLKQRSGLSYARIGTLTHYSKSSWERWINGKQFPPRGAVESFAGAVRTDVGPLLELWERAELPRAVAEPGPEPEPDLAEGEGESAASAPGAEAEPGTEAEPGAGTAGPETEARTEAEPGTAGPEAETDAESGAAEPEAGGAPASLPVADSVRGPRRWRSARLIGAVAAACAVLAAGAFAAVHYATDRSGGGADTGSGSTADTAMSAYADPVGCTRAGCTAKDPAAMGCSRDGQTLALIRNEEMVIELRYSRACGAAWGRITYAKPKAVVDVNNSEGTSEASPVHWGNDVYSPMTELSGTRTAWACGTQPDGKSRTCTVHSPVPAAH
ncbi:DUF2690 domain-containing protein [Streptomyces sp. NPDC004042]|uniref:DUF2690 domain-containing protein n=1 Tax=Streptomyces sp. NPDC004042 TaxID=3154451 RepID=UPI0033A7842D